MFSGLRAIYMPLCQVLVQVLHRIAEEWSFRPRAEFRSASTPVSTITMVMVSSCFISILQIRRRWGRRVTRWFWSTLLATRTGHQDPRRLGPALHRSTAVRGCASSLSPGHLGWWMDGRLLASTPTPEPAARRWARRCAGTTMTTTTGAPDPGRRRRGPPGSASCSQATPPNGLCRCAHACQRRHTVGPWRVTWSPWTEATQWPCSVPKSAATELDPRGTVFLSEHCSVFCFLVQKMIN
jgi:hypothetical protein